MIQTLAPLRLRALAALFLLGLAACGGEGEEQPGNNPPEVQGGIGPISAQVNLYAASGTQPARATASIRIQTVDWTSWITDATVRINGQAVPFNPSQQRYTADLDVQSGQTLTLAIDKGTTHYTTSHVVGATFPNITSPASGSIFPNVGTIDLQIASRPPTAEYARYRLQAVGTIPYPWIDADYKEQPTSVTSYGLRVNAFAPRVYQFNFGLVEEFPLPGAAVNSYLILAMYSPFALDIRAVPNEVHAWANPEGAFSAVALGESRQLDAYARSNCCADQRMPTGANWTSSNPAVASISVTGVITGNASGTVDVTYEYLGVTDTFAVTVFDPLPSPAPPLANSVTLNVDYSHSGAGTLGGAGLALPLTGRWSRTFEGEVSYPVVADGRVFVSVGQRDVTAGLVSARLYALDVTNGDVLWGPVVVTNQSTWAPLAYDQGRLFVVTRFTGEVRALDPATGSTLWSRELGYALAGVAPMARGGLVYVAGYGLVSALDAVTGARVWTASDIAGGGGSSPTWAPDGLFVSGCNVTYKFNPVSGAPLWQQGAACGGIGGPTIVYADGRVLARRRANTNTTNTTNTILDAATGNNIGSFQNSRIPAAANDRAYYLDNAMLTAVDPGTGNTNWTFTGDGGLSSAPLVIDNVVAIGSTSGNVYLLDALNGALLWTGTAGAGLNNTNEVNTVGVVTGLGLGAGYLLVPADNTLTGWKMVP